MRIGQGLLYLISIFCDHLFPDGKYSDVYLKAEEGQEIKGKTEEEVKKILKNHDRLLYKVPDAEEETFTPFLMHLSEERIGIFSEVDKDIALLVKEEK